jgi:hypothetical protein
MKTYLTILDITIEKLIERIGCKSDIVVTTINSVFRNCCYEILGYLEKNDIKIKGKLKNDNIHVQVFMENSVYSRKIGKYVKDQRWKILSDLSILIRFRLERINWKKILKK